jgi:hypothetical protein
MISVQKKPRLEPLETGQRGKPRFPALASSSPQPAPHTDPHLPPPFHD